MGIRPFACERAREWVSLQLDDELSELERTLMRAHLVRCADCSVFASDLGALTGRLRSESLELLAQPIVVPARRRVGLRALNVAAGLAAGVAAAFVLGVSVAGSSSKNQPQAGPVFKEPVIAFDADAIGLRRATASLQETPTTNPRMRRLSLDV